MANYYRNLDGGRAGSLVRTERGVEKYRSRLSTARSLFSMLDQPRLYEMVFDRVMIAQSTSLSISLDLKQVPENLAPRHLFAIQTPRSDCSDLLGGKLRDQCFLIASALSRRFLIAGKAYTACKSLHHHYSRLLWQRPRAGDVPGRTKPKMFSRLVKLHRRS